MAIFDSSIRCWTLLQPRLRSSHGCPGAPARLWARPRARRPQPSVSFHRARGVPSIVLDPKAESDAFGSARFPCPRSLPHLARTSPVSIPVGPCSGLRSSSIALLPATNGPDCCRPRLCLRPLWSSQTIAPSFISGLSWLQRARLRLGHLASALGFGPSFISGRGPSLSFSRFQELGQPPRTAPLGLLPPRPLPFGHAYVPHGHACGLGPEALLLCTRPCTFSTLSQIAPSSTTSSPMRTRGTAPTPSALALCSRSSRLQHRLGPSASIADASPEAVLSPSPSP